MNRAAADDAARRARRRLVLLAACLPLVLLAAAALGAVTMGPADLWKLLSGSADVPAVVRAVFWEIRVPRVLLAALVGGSLALAGAGVQGLFRNPLADPALIGVTAGAALGAVLCFFFGWEGLLGGWFLPLAAFAGGLLAVLILMSFHSGFAAGGTAKLILAGVALNAMPSASVQRHQHPPMCTPTAEDPPHLERKLHEFGVTVARSVDQVRRPLNDRRVRQPLRRLPLAEHR